MYSYLVCVSLAGYNHIRQYGENVMKNVAVTMQTLAPKLLPIEKMADLKNWMSQGRAIKYCTNSAGQENK